MVANSCRQCFGRHLRLEAVDDARPRACCSEIRKRRRVGSCRVPRRAEYGELYDFRRAIAKLPGNREQRVRPQRGGEVDIPQSGLTCWYYMSAIQNMSVLETPRGVRLLGICAPPETTLMDYVRVFVARGSKRGSQGDNAAALAVVILSESFPCNAHPRSH